jgi:hypothetical protein
MRIILLYALLLAAPVFAADEATPKPEAGAPAAKPELGATVFGVKPVATRYLYDGQPGKLKVGNQLWFGDRLLLQPSGQVKLILADGSTVKVEGGSDFTLSPPQEGLGQLLSLAKGLLRVVASPQSGAQRLRVATNSAAVAVKGTQFQVEALEGKSELKVLEGSVEIGAPQGGTPTAVAAGEAVLSYPDRVDTVRKMNFQEVKALRSAFKDLVKQQQLEYAKRVRAAKGKRTIKGGK